MTTDRDQEIRPKSLSRKVLSLRALLILVLLIGGGLGWIVHTARVQHDAVATVQRLGGRCWYDWEVQNRRPAPGSIPGWRRWLITNLGPDYMGTVTQVYVCSSPSKTPPTLDDLASIGRLTGPEHLSLINLASPRLALARIRDLGRLKHLDLSRSGGIEGGDLTPLANFPRLEELQLSLTSLTDADLAQFAGLTRLQHLSLSTPTSRRPGSGPSITDDGLLALGGMHDLKSLQISGDNRITNAGLAYIARLTRLQSLTIQGEKLTSVEPLRPLVGLKYLGIGGTGFNDSSIDDAGAASFADLTGLISVNLMGCKTFTNAGLAHLRALPNLVDLDLSGSAVDDAGVASLVEFPMLKNIFLSFTPMTDAGLAALAKRPGCETIDVGFTKVSPEGVEAARAALPGTTIRHRVMPTEGITGGFSGSVRSLAP